MKSTSVVLLPLLLPFNTSSIAVSSLTHFFLILHFYTPENRTMGRNELIYCFNFCYLTLTIYLFIIICSHYSFFVVIFEHIHHINLRLSFSNFLSFECVFDCWEDFQMNLILVSVPFIPPENTIKPLVLFSVLGEYNGKETFRLSY